MPNRGSQGVRDTQYQWLVHTYGERCIICGAAPPKGQKLQIDEISYGKEDFNKPENISLVCSSCNSFLRGKDEEEHRRIIDFHRHKRLVELEKARKEAARQRHPPTTEEKKLNRQLKAARKKTGIDTPLPDDSFKEAFDYMNGSSEQKANAKFYHESAVFIWKELIGHGPQEENELKNSAAYITGANPTTVKRYLDMWCSKHGPLCRTNNGGLWMIYFKNPAQAQKAGLGKEAGK